VEAAAERSIARRRSRWFPGRARAAPRRGTTGPARTPFLFAFLLFSSLLLHRARRADTPEQDQKGRVSVRGGQRGKPRIVPWVAVDATAPRPGADAREREFRECFASKPEAEGSRLLSADCRTSLCRLRIAHDEPAALSRFEGSLGLYHGLELRGGVRPGMYLEDAG
jgi:hypothetical protein